MCCLGKYQAYITYFVDKKAELSHFSKSNIKGASHDGMTLGSTWMFDPKVPNITNGAPITFSTVV